MTLAIIQARLGSTRLPQKSLMDIAGKPLIQHVVERVEAIRGVDQIVLAVPYGQAEDFGRFAVTKDPDVPEMDVLARFAFVVEHYPEHDTIMRFTADCCFIDPICSANVLAIHQSGGYDYTHNTGVCSRWPEGIDTEVISRSALMIANREAISSDDREHVTKFVREARGRRFKRQLVPNRNSDWSSLHFSVDTRADLERANQISRSLPDGKTDVRTLVMTARAIERFWANVDRSEDGCWLWGGKRFTDGYGRTQFNRHGTRAHRLAYELCCGTIPDGYLVCHRCDMPHCCRPDHLFLGTPKDNTADGIAKGRIVAIGEGNPNSKLTLKEVVDVRHGFAAGQSKWDLARQFGVSAGSIIGIVTGRNWKHAPGPISKAVGVSSKPKYRVSWT